MKNMRTDERLLFRFVIKSTPNAKEPRRLGWAVADGSSRLLTSSIWLSNTGLQGHTGQKDKFT